MNNLNTKSVFERSVYKECGISGVGKEIWYISLLTANGIYYINLNWQTFNPG